MQIDNYAEAIALTEKLEATLPFKVRAGKPLLKTMRERGEIVTPDQEFTVDLVKYSGDIGGINCGLVSDRNNKERYVVSITHLKIDPNHPLAAEVKAYQQRRIRMLKLQEQKGFAAEILASQLGRKTKKRSHGFGRERE
ncbi:MAG TPA: hypothetical protein DCL61_18615 [Cyanobacteria bacterium UBA12227]|nr:hypothetical protein [Cyanobacteria bacterium UBA12227]HAX90234.1 hypothetical protein [Cyanobacteria bacterium UBA11370]HBY79548.1 hypothetical protein [Cyanobacteria bacterium UBA11148]